MPLADLQLWTENPRDPVDSGWTNQQIVEKALEDAEGAWKLPSMLSAMGARYDFSELPTVCFEGDKPIVWDGNRRVAIGMLKHGIIPPIAGLSQAKLDEIDFPDTIPCNVCSKDVAVDNVLRKHRAVGSWKPLNRDRFIEEHKGETSFFLTVEDATGLITNNPVMNQGFVKNEILTKAKLSQVGLDFDDDGNLVTNFSDSEREAVFQRMVALVRDGKLSTREKRGELYKSLVGDPTILGIFDSHNLTPSGRRTRKRTSADPYPIFGKALNIWQDEVWNQYLATEAVYKKLSKEIQQDNNREYTAIVRMAMRLLVELAAIKKYGDGTKRQISDNIKKLIDEHYSEAKGQLDDEEKHLVRDNAVNSNQALLQQLQSGAHHHIASGSHDKLLAISALVGRILELTFPREAGS